MDVHSLHWWPDAKLEALARRFAQAMRDWCAAWGIAAPTEVLCLRAHEHAVAGGALRVCASGTGDARHAMLMSEKSLVQQVYGALFEQALVPDDAPCHQQGATSTIAHQLALQAVRDLVGVLFDIVRVTPELTGVDAACQRTPDKAWSGAVIIDFPGGALDFFMHLNAPCATSLMLLPHARLPMPGLKLPPLSVISEALQSSTVRLHVNLSPVEIDLASLQTLVTGDVIRLPHLLDDPLHVQADGDEARLCAAYLGQRQDQRAVELMRPRPDHSNSKQERP